MKHEKSNNDEILFIPNKKAQSRKKLLSQYHVEGFI